MSTPSAHDGILVGVDGSPPSKVAVDWAAREALLRNLPLTLIHVIPSPTVAMWSEVPPPQTWQCSWRRTARRCCAMRAGSQSRQPRDVTR